MNKKTVECVERVKALGISDADAWGLRRIAMTLHRWHEMECGNSNNHGSWTITRGKKENGAFVYDDDGKPFIERHSHTDSKVRYEPIADRETGALKRLRLILAKYSELGFYVQGDPRGAALYIVRYADVPEFNHAPDTCYSRGVAVYQ